MIQCGPTDHWPRCLPVIVILVSVSSFAGISGEYIFPFQEKHVHSSSIVECPNGDLLVCWFYGSGERKADDVLIQGARRKHSTAVWSKPFLMADTPDLPDCNPVLLVGPAKKLWLFWIAVQAKRWENAVLKLRTTSDFQKEGPPSWHWQDVILLKPGDVFADKLLRGLHELGPRSPLWSDYAPKYVKMISEAAHDAAKRQTGWMTRTHPLVLSSGRFLLPLYSDGFNVGLVALSDDSGKTWRASHPIVGLGNVQPSLVEKKNGDIVAFMRDNGGAPKRVQTSVSHDRGESWTLASDMDIYNPGSSLEVIALRSGVWVMVGNDTEEGRHRLSVYVSRDEGASWQRHKYLEKAGPGSDSFSYPSVIQASNGTIHVTYSYRASGKGKTIKYVAFSEAWLE